MFKISNLIEKFQLNVAVANFYEITHVVNETNYKKYKHKMFKRNTDKNNENLMPFVPHIASECLYELEGKIFIQKIKWPKVDKIIN